MNGEKGAYRPRRIKRNPLPHLPRYFKTLLWKDLREKLEKAEHICFIIVQNGEVNNVYIKSIQTDEKTPGYHAATPEVEGAGIEESVASANIPPKASPKSEEPLHQDLDPTAEEIEKARKEYKETGGIPFEDEEIPEEAEEVSELPPETPAIAPNPIVTPDKP